MAVLVADAADTSVVTADQQEAPVNESDVAQATPDCSFADDSCRQENAVAQTRELVLVDTTADNYRQLLDDIVNNSDETRSFDVFAFDSDRDGIEQISELLSNYRDVDALHIVSHGTDGNVKLGNSWLNLNNLAAYAPQLASWNDALTSDADLLIYGCELAQTAEGQEFVEALSVLTGADVAASDDDTGHATLGGDWHLEYSTGAIEADLAFSMDVQQNWFGLLATSETHYFLTGSGIPAATLDPTLPTATAIPDYDDARHAPVGTLVSKSGVGFGESNPVKHQLWETAAGSINIDGPVKLNIWTHIKDFNTSKGATVHAYLIDIRNNGTDAQLVASDTVTREPRRELGRRHIRLRDYHAIAGRQQASAGEGCG